MTQSRTAQALAMLKTHPELNPYQVAKLAGIHYSTLYKAMKQANRPVCPACGRRILKTIK